MLEERLTKRVWASLGWLARRLATVALVLAAAVAAVIIWQAYVAAPWTRDGRTRVQVANIAPQISGQITRLDVVDNQHVRKGDLLYVIDPFDYRTSLDDARATLQMRAADLLSKRQAADRRFSLNADSTSVEEKQTYSSSAAQAEAAFRAAQSALSQAEVNLRRTEIRSPVNGTVTNLQMRVGDYARAGTNNLAVIDADSFWIDGYFEETKMPYVCVGEAATATLMGYHRPIQGVVESITRGISTSDAAASTQGLPDVNPVYTWVRLAQRIPVRIRITQVPADLPLVAGMTVSVSLASPRFEQQGRGLAGVRNALAGLFDRGAAPSAACSIAEPSGGVVAAIPEPEPEASPAASQVNPGLAPGMTAAPTLRSIDPASPRPGR